MRTSQKQPSNGRQTGISNPRCSGDFYKLGHNVQRSHGRQKQRVCPDWRDGIPDEIEPADIHKLMFECAYLTLARIRAGTLSERENSAIFRTLLTLFGRKYMIDDQNATGTAPTTEEFRQYVYMPFAPDGTPVRSFASKPVIPMGGGDSGQAERQDDDRH